MYGMIRLLYIRVVIFDIVSLCHLKFTVLVQTALFPVTAALAARNDEACGVGVSESSLLRSVGLRKECRLCHSTVWRIQVIDFLVGSEGGGFTSSGIRVLS